MKIIGLVEKFGEWSLERFPIWLFRIAIALSLLTLGVQLGLCKGRQLGRAEVIERYAGR